MKTTLLFIVSCLSLIFSNYTFAARYHVPTSTGEYQAACDRCNGDYSFNESCDSCGSYDDDDYYQSSCNMNYYNPCKPFFFRTSCACTDPGADYSPCLSCNEYCHVFGNIGGRNYESIYCCGC